MSSWRSRSHPNPKGTAPPPIVRRWTGSGYYVALSQGQSAGGMPGGAVRTGVKGLVVRYNWQDIEPNGHTDPLATRYVWTKPDRDIAQCAALGVQIFMMVVIKSFDNTAPPICLPADLIAVADGGSGATTYATFFPGSSSVPSGWMDWRWNTAVVQPRLAELYKAFGARYDLNANFGGMVTQETSVSGVNTNTAGDGFYTKAAYVTALKLEAQSIAAWCPHGRQLMFTNQIAGGGSADLDAIAAFAQPLGVIWGGPDLVTQGGIVTTAYPTYVKYQNGTSPIPDSGPTACSLQNAEYDPHPPGDDPVNFPNLYNWATSTWTYGNPSDPTMDHRPAGAFPSKIGKLSIIIPDYHLTGLTQFDPDVTDIMAAHPTLPGAWSPP